MPIPVECDACGKRYKMNDSLAGETVPCKECGEDIDVPGGRRRGSAGKKRGRSQNGQNPGLIIAGAGGGIAIISLIAFLLLGKNGGNPPAPPVIPNPTPVIAANNAPTASTPQQTTVPPPQFGPGQAKPKSAETPKTNPNTKSNAQVGGMAREGSVNLPRSGDSTSAFGPKESKAEDTTVVSSTTTNWAAQPDPQPDASPLEISRKLSFKLGDRAEINSVLFPCVPSSIIAVGDNKSANAAREIWNLATNSKVGTVKGLAFSSQLMAISPDGLYLAAAFESNVDVWDVKAKKSLGRFSLGRFSLGKARRSLRFLEFTRPDRLLGISDDYAATLLKMPSGDEDRDFKLPDQVEADACGISPNGRYLAYPLNEFKGNSFEIRDLDSNDVVGTITINKTQHRYKLTQIAFSPKGDEVAALLDDGWNHVVVKVWNMKDGDEVDTVVLDPDLIKGLDVRHSKEPPLVWFPGGTRWLYKGHGVIDRAAQQLVFKLPKSKVEVSGSRRPLTDTIVTVVDGNRDNAVVIGFQLSESVLAKVKESVTSGGLPGDAALPPLTKPDWSSIEDVTFADRDGVWKVLPDPAPEPPEKLLLRSMPLKQGKGEVRQVAVSRADAARLYARVVETEAKGGQRDEKNIKETWMDVYDLAARKPTNKIKMPLPFEMLAISPEGGHVLVQTTAAVGRIDVYAASGEHTCGWRPYQDEQNENQREVVGAAFVDAEHLATVNAGNKLVMWKLPECKAIYGIANAALPSLTQGAKYLTYADVNTYDFRDALSGKSVGEIRVEDGKGIASVSFHPNGERLAILLDDRGSMFLLDVDLKNGQASEPIPVPPDYGPVQPEAKDAYVAALQRMQAEFARLQRGQNRGSRALGATMPMHWCGDNYLLLNNYRLFDVKQKLVVWQYALPVGAHLTTSSDGRHWYVTTKTAKGSGPPFLAAQMLPDKFATKELAGKTLEPNYVLAPDMTIGIQTKLLNPPNNSNFAMDVWNAISKSFAKNNVKFAENQQTNLVLSMEQKSGQSMQYRERGTGNITSVQQQFIVCTAALESGGKRHWEESTQSTNSLWSVYKRADESLESKLADAMWIVPSTYFQKLAYPAYVFDKISTDGRGVSVLTSEGTDLSR